MFRVPPGVAMPTVFRSLLFTLLLVGLSSYFFRGGVAKAHGGLILYTQSGCRKIYSL